MHPIITKTFGGLSSQYYFRNFVFGIIFPGIFYLVFSKGPKPMPFSLAMLLFVNTLLYPYSRFVYEGVVGFVLGRNVLLVNVWIMLAAKFVTMALCWSFAIFIAPIGLVYLYFRNGQAVRSQQ